jgi:hypothetical protein
MFENVRDAWAVLRNVKVAVRQPQAGARPVRIGSPPEATDDDISILSASGEFYKSWTHLEPDRLSIYGDMDDMMTYVLAASAMDAYVEDATQPDFKSGKVVMIKSANAEVQQMLDKFAETIELDDRVYGDLFHMAKYGDYFTLLMVDQEKGVFDACPLEPRIVWRHEDSRRVLKGFTIGDSSENSSDAKNDVPKYKPWDVVHWRLRSKRIADPYGMPFFFHVRMVYKMLKLMEEQMVMYRMNMHPDRLIFKVFTGNGGVEERRRVVRMWRREMEKHMSIDRNSGVMRAEYAPWMVNQNVYWPVGTGDDKSGVEKFAGCFSGDTKISLLDGTDVEIQNLVGRKEFGVYSFGPDGRFYPGRGHSARCTQRNAPVVKVTLDTGESVRCTPDHRFMLRDGTYRQAQELLEGDSLMPLYRKSDRFGYETLAVNRPLEKARPLRCGKCGGLRHNRRSCGRAVGSNWVHTHRLVSLETEGTRLPEGQVIHHADFNRRNNNPGNLIRMSAEDHNALHRQNLARSIHSPDAKRRAAEHTRMRYADPEWRAKKCAQQADLMRRQQQDPVFRAKTQANFSKQSRENLSSNGRKANHKRWHTEREVKSDSCILCTVNHKVISVEPDGFADVYDITVDGYHNFSLSAGVVVHNSANSGDILDVAYLRDLFFAGVRIPKAYMGFEDSQGYRGTDTLSSQSIKFARGVKRLQRYYLQGLIRLFKIHLATQGIDAREPRNSFSVEMSPTSYLDEAHKAELYAKRYESLNYMLDIGAKMAQELNINKQTWAKYILKEFGGWDDDTISQFTAPSGTDPDAIFIPKDSALTFEQKEALEERIMNDSRLVGARETLALSEAAAVVQHSQGVPTQLPDAAGMAVMKQGNQAVYEEGILANRQHQVKIEKEDRDRRKGRREHLRKIAENWQAEAE